MLVSVLYLSVIHDIGRRNATLVSELLSVDERTGQNPCYNRVRGLSKIIGKFFWWLGNQERAGVKETLVR